MMTPDMHQNQPVLATGAELDTAAKAAVILLHGRGASAESILQLAGAFNEPDVIFLAPQAANAAWYPNRFIAPIASNEPALSSALRQVKHLLDHLKNSGLPTEKIILAGFSQGACLAVEYAARNPQRYGGVWVFSGGLIGELNKPLVYAEDTDLQRTPIFLGCSDVDFHIPKQRVQESADVLQKMNADVTMRLYPGMDHTINADELEVARQMLTQVLSR
jgi:phospholipase/carboxylesterase